MSKLFLRVLGEMLIAVSLAGLVLGAGLPMLLKAEIVAKGDTASTCIVAATLVIAVAGALFRPGSPLNRRRK
ncbi:MAG: hypothetical protein ND807_02240 [Vicinamibacterales bacterium]|nr:hypothetical protein [Vicinamibacterales bacterium]